MEIKVKRAENISFIFSNCIQVPVGRLDPGSCNHRLDMSQTCFRHVWNKLMSGWSWYLLIALIYAVVPISWFIYNKRHGNLVAGGLGISRTITYYILLNFIKHKEHASLLYQLKYIYYILYYDIIVNILKSILHTFVWLFIYFLLT